MYKADCIRAFFEGCSAVLKRSSDAKIVVAYVFENQIGVVLEAAQRMGLKETLCRRLPIDASQLASWQILDYGEECIIQEFQFAELDSV